MSYIRSGKISKAMVRKRESKVVLTREKSMSFLPRRRAKREKGYWCERVSDCFLVGILPSRLGMKI